MPIFAEYIWVDGTAPSRTTRSKTRILPDEGTPHSKNPLDPISVAGFPAWNTDGSSTYQAYGKDSDIGLLPVRAVMDPLRGGTSYLVLCEVLTPRGVPHPSNTRAPLRRLLENGADSAMALFGFEQEYTFLGPDRRPLAFPAGGFPAAQGPYYCAVGTFNVFGRGVYEDFMQAAVAAGLAIVGTNFEVMPGQAEFQIGTVDALTACDHLWLARWLLHRITEEHGIAVTFDAKPVVDGDWNGAGMHANISTQAMREPGGLAHIEAACRALASKRQEHLDVYGHNYQQRLTGHHETCSYREFRFGVADRTASVRIPRHVAHAGCGYLEDRRPNANADPYEVACRLLRTILSVD
ncbi:MAG: glutamine synthetase beta-grasp domain-containing protein [Myxococcales bacterium]|nr:glutamine synthetase beta-grasp domain-containing protein [Myxococcales bacterium]